MTDRIGLADLLGRLGSSTRLAQGTAPPQSSGGASFEDMVRSMLDAARRGEVVTDRAVQIAPGLDASLSKDDMAAIALATDRAEAAGATSLAVLLDDRSLTIDVARRTITEVGPIQRGTVRTGPDAFVDLRTSSNAEEPKLGVATDMLQKLGGPRRTA